MRRVANLFRRIRLRMITSQLDHARERRRHTGPDAYGDRLIADLERRRVRLRGKLLLSARTIHERRDLIVFAVCVVSMFPWEHLKP